MNPTTTPSFKAWLREHRLQRHDDLVHAPAQRAGPSGETQVEEKKQAGVNVRPDPEEIEQFSIDAAELLARGISLVFRALLSIGDTAAQDEWLTTEQAGNRAGVKPATVRTWIQNGLLPASRVGRELRVLSSDLGRYLRACGEARSVSLPSGRSHPRVLKMLDEEVG